MKKCQQFELQVAKRNFYAQTHSDNQPIANGACVAHFGCAVGSCGARGGPECEFFACFRLLS
jgi:hypothetical protein